MWSMESHKDNNRNVRPFTCVFFQIQTAPECRPEPSSGGGSHRHSDLLQEQRPRSVDTGRRHRHPELWVRRLKGCDVINVIHVKSSRELRMFLLKTVCAGSMM